MKKEQPRLGLIYHIVVSMIVWQLIFYFLLNAVLKKIMLGFDLKMLIIKYNLLWIVVSCIILFVSYFFNRKNTTARQNFSSVRRTSLIWFYIITFIANISRIKVLIEYYPAIEITCIIIHMVLAFVLNRILFKKYIEN